MKNTDNNNINCDCAVIGGGAAGMMAAITAAKDKKLKVIIIEHTTRLGSKLLQTGNGKCNFTNLNMLKEMYQNENSDFVWDVIKHFDVPQTLNFFKNIGVYHKEKNGYVYPNSETAASLQDALRLEVENCKIQTLLDCTIETIHFAPNSYYHITTNAGKICARSLILATGSKAAPKTGSDGSGYTLAKQLGHSIVKPLPALVQLISDDGLCKSMAGVRSTGVVSLYIDGSFVVEDTGELQYTDYGISGIPIFQISRYAVKAVDVHSKVKVVLDMLPDYTLDELSIDIGKRIQSDGYKTIEQFFGGLLNKKLVHAVAKRVGVGINDTASYTGSKKIMYMLQSMKQFEIKITGYKAFENAQICQGGVSLSEVTSSTMQSKLHPGLFFAGELLDVDGKCGGYNLQWAWSSGYVAGASAQKYIEENAKIQQREVQAKKKNEVNHG